MRKPIHRGLCRRCGCTHWARYSSWSRYSCRAAWWALATSWATSQAARMSPIKKLAQWGVSGPACAQSRRGHSHQNDFVPGRHHGELRWLSCAQRFDAYINVGELRCIIGPNGAGKTTMMDVIHRQDASRQRHGILWTDHRLAGVDRTGDCAGRHGRKFQKPTVFEQHSVFDIWNVHVRPQGGMANAACQLDRGANANVSMKY